MQNSSIYLKRLFSKETVEKIKKINKNFSYLDLMSVGNGAIRPAGASYREQLAKGEFKDNGHEELNKALAKTNGFLVYQEQIIQFLHEFCGYTMGEADIVRRHFAKKTGTEDDIPKIKAGFIKTMKEKYDVDHEESEKIVVDFLQVIEDASDYLFSENHALPYSMIGYMCGWLRYYYPVEFCSVYMNTYFDNEEKLNKILSFMAKQGIVLEPPKFRHSKENYVPDRENNKIYKGMKSIKYINNECSNQLYDMRMIDFQTFTDLLVYVCENTHINVRQMRVLATIDFFSEFGNNEKLLKTIELFSKRYSKSHKDTTKAKRIEEIKDYEKSIENSSLPLNVQIVEEMEYLGYISIRRNIEKRYVYVVSIDTKYSPRCKLYCLATGKTIECKVDKAMYGKKGFMSGQILYCKSFTKRENWSKRGDSFVKNGTFSDVLVGWDVIPYI